jgi:tetratricopeptide (TPR) repeat protein
MYPHPRSTTNAFVKTQNSKLRTQNLVWLALLALGLGAGPAAAQPIAWRYDYAEARREAQEKGLPMLLDFGTDHCFWCVKLDTTTFRDPAIVALLNTNFVPLKVHASQNPTLTEYLRIQSFPTVVLAAPDGKILATIDGYKEAVPFHDYLQRALTALSNPEWMTRDYQAATRAIAESDYGRAIALLRNVIEDGKSRGIQIKSRQLLDDLEQQAANRLVRAKQLQDRGQNSEALDAISELLRSFNGTLAAAEAGQMLKTLMDKPEIKALQRTRRARELLAQAKEDYRTQQYLCCMERCEVLATNYPDLTEGNEAVQLANEIKNNPDWMRQACDSLSERLGLLYLSLAETWMKKGQPQQAAACLERVVQSFPGTRQAEMAQVRLSQMQGQPTQRANFKKQ